MKYFIILLTFFLFHGCLYFNDRGVSSHLYDNCHSYYDADGNFIEKCDGNIIDYDEAKDGIVAIKDEIKDNVATFTNNVQDKVSNITKSSEDKNSGINIQDLKEEEIINLKNPITIESEIESNQCPCR
jgi:hypothetical protein